MKKSEIFRKGSTTYYFSSIFFPKDVREMVSTLYAFVRVADDFVDTIPQDKQGFYDFKSKTLGALDGTKSGDHIIDDFVKLAKAQSFDRSWTENFIRSMEADLFVARYETQEDLDKYIYGSADVIGLMMARIMDLPEESFAAARKLGSSMQLINFIRDIKEDLSLGRIYLPLADIRQFGLSENIADEKDKEAFSRLVKYEIEKYMKITQEAEKGFGYIPRRLRVSIMTANDMYKWTAKKFPKIQELFLRKRSNHRLFMYYPDIFGIMYSHISQIKIQYETFQICQTCKGQNGGEYRESWQ